MSHNHNYGSISTPPVAFIDSVGRDYSYLCDNAVTNIYKINTGSKTLENALKTIGTKKDSQSFRNSIHITQSNTNQIATATSKDLNRLKSLVVAGDKQRQLQVEKLEENFKDAVSRYYALQTDVANKQKSNFLLSVSIEDDNTADTDAEQQRQAQLSREMEFEQDMLIERESRIKQIEADVLDVNQIMRELGSLVHAQGEAIDTIENSIDHATGNVEEGTEQLLKASQYQNRYRKKLLVLVVIVLVVAVILVAVLVSHFRR